MNPIGFCAKEFTLHAAAGRRGVPRSKSWIYDFTTHVHCPGLHEVEQVANGRALAMRFISSVQVKHSCAAFFRMASAGLQFVLCCAIGFA
uniref:Uncharacterized protein n=1 Tax=Polaromonas sp. H6N TaxID=1840293 RepID=A0A2S1FI88_9BURK|nr:hypothetical protein pH6NP1_p020 [Polaromonas sp. H6N]